jgi:hypothetical protein
MLAGDRLSAAIRGAMCGYGVFHASPWGFRSLYATAGTAVAAGIVSELYSLDARVRTFDLARSLAIATLVLAPLAALDFGLASAFALDLDLSVVASCCSVQLDAIAAGAAGPGGLGTAARTFASAGAGVSIATAVGLAVFVVRRPRSGHIVAAGIASLVAFPFAIAATLLEVAPHAFELPQHVCPFCLLRPSVLGIGYPLFGAILLAVTWGAGAALGASLSRTEASRSALRGFAQDRFRREAVAWMAVVFFAVLPVARYAVVSGGVSLFQ